MKNFIQPGQVLTLLAPAAVAAGVGVLVGSIFGVSQSAAGSGAEVEVATQGVFTLAKTTGEAWTQGVRIYWNDSTKACTTTASTNKLIGVATAAAASGDALGNVLLTAAFTL